MPENLVPRDGFSSPVPRRHAHFHTQAESGAFGIPPEFRDGVHLFIYNRHTPSGRSRVHRVTQLSTNGVHCRESDGTEPVNLKVVPNECCLGRSHGPVNMHLSFPHPLLYWYEVREPLFVTPCCNTSRATWSTPSEPSHKNPFFEDLSFSALLHEKCCNTVLQIGAPMK